MTDKTKNTKEDNKKLFARAWEIARDGAEKFGGNPAEYFDKSLWFSRKEQQEIIDYTFHYEIEEYVEERGEERNFPSVTLMFFRFVK